MTQTEDAERLIESVLAALNEADPVRLVAIIREANDQDGPASKLRPEAEQEYRIEAEAIAHGIRHQERGRGMLDRREIAAIVGSVIDRYFEVRMSDREASEIAGAIVKRRGGTAGV